MSEYVKKCKGCGIEFKATVKYQYYCSPECRTRYHNDKKQAERPVYKRVCSICGKKFETTDVRKMFCNLKCTHKAHKEREKAQRRAKMAAAIKTCPTCGKEFNPNVHNQEFCCKSCLRKAEWAEYKETIKHQYEKTCPTCDKHFTARVKAARYCSTGCSSKGWAQNNKEKLKEYKKQYREENREHIAKHLKEYCEKHRDELRIKKCEYVKNRAKTDQVFRLRNMCRSMVRRCLVNKKQKRAQEVLGYSPSELKAHLESLFYNDMNWDNTKNWEIHHIIPLDTFDFVNEDGSDNYDMIREANSLSNLVPLFKEDHKKLSLMYVMERKYLTLEEIKEMVGSN